MREIAVRWWGRLSSLAGWAIRQNSDCLPGNRFYYYFCGACSAYVLAASFIPVPPGEMTFFMRYYGIADLWPLRLMLLAFLFIFAVLLRRSPGLGFENVGLRVVATMIFFMFWPAFTSVKAYLGVVLDYVWDPPLAAFDRFLHGGRDAWEVYAELAPFLGVWALDRLYGALWIAVSVFAPPLILVAERDTWQKARFFAVYAAVWIALGNILAALFLSAGPIYYDHFVGSDGRYAALLAHLRDIGFEQSLTARAQAMLLQSYVSGAPQVGSGISAFPSVHVGMATLVALYVHSRFGRIGALAYAYPLTIQLLSVLSGYHYAIDGYASVVIVFLAWHTAARVFGVGKAQLSARTEGAGRPR